MNGFLPSSDPLQRLPAGFEPWEEVAHSLPKLLVSDKLRPTLKRLPSCDVTGLNEAELKRAMLLLSYFGHAFVWGKPPPPESLPASIAVPWCEVAKRLGRPPVLSYASYALYNWRRIDPNGPIALGNIALLQNFLGGVDEEWFILVHVDIEAKAAPAIAALGSPEGLPAIADALRQMNATMQRMPEQCDPYIYYNRVRPYIHGWKNQPALPEGLIYEGVYDNKPQQFRGETGAQSSIVPALDAALGITHKPDMLSQYLQEMRDYMPPAHRTFIAGIRSVREYVLAHPELHEAYNACVIELEKFRGKHFEYAARYIHQQAQRDAANPTDVGTGGTPFMPYLGKHLSETAEHLIPPR
jgi:indoleamine 2,3-dioxygenase